jgi:hypothetical protein
MDLVKERIPISFGVSFIDKFYFWRGIACVEDQLDARHERPYVLANGGIVGRLQSVPGRFLLHSKSEALPCVNSKIGYSLIPTKCLSCVEVNENIWNLAGICRKLHFLIQAFCVDNKHLGILGILAFVLVLPGC